MKYKIVQKQIWPCRFTEVKLQTNRANGSKFIVAKLGKYDTGEFLRSIILGERTYNTLLSEYESLLSEIKKRKYRTIERIVIQPQNYVYHILTWDDVDRKICTMEHLNEVQRNKEGKPILFKQIVIFANIDNLNRFSVDEVLLKEFIEINSPRVQDYLNFNNQQYYLQQQEEKRKLQEAEYCQMMSDLYDAYEEKRYSDTRMSAEEMVMSALENGNGELFGY